MGIHGIFKEIGPGERIALSKLAVEKFEQTGRPLRIAIDVSIWLFQIQAGKGGTNPALRTFYYRLLRVMSLSIHPIFVFDGPNKPPFKRNKRTGANVASIPEFLAKQLLKQFGFPIHRAPGEAEAECALLQREGIVDAVLSEDVDTLMFGSGITLKNWSAEKSGSTPTHVNLYDAEKTRNGPSGLDREGMILVALMSGGDYMPGGIPGCGPKIACEAARAGFGMDLCNIRKGDTVALQAWRSRLQHELKTNESKHFKQRHATLSIPDDFPPTDILGYYTHPAISNRAALDKLRQSLVFDQDIDLPGLRNFTIEAFDWRMLEGAKHFIRSLAPSLLVRQLRLRGKCSDPLPDDVNVVQEEESKVVKDLYGKRQHDSTDNSTEIRVGYIPIELVKIDLDKEERDEEHATDGGQPDGNAEIDLDMDLMGIGNEDAPRKRGPTKFDPFGLEREWVMEAFVRVGVPLKIQDWEASLQRPKKAASAREATKPATRKTATRRTKTAGSLPQASITSFSKVTKPGVKRSQPKATTQSDQRSASQEPRVSAEPCRTLIELLSSSPVKPKATSPPPQTLQETLSPVQEEMPSSVSRRRKRAPIQRSRTLPADLSGPIDRPLTPPPMDAIETLDLVSSQILPSPSLLPAKKAKTRSDKDPSLLRATRQTSVLSSPGSTRSKQTTLDTWARSSGPPSPTKPRKTTPPPSTSSALPPSKPEPQKDAIDLLDLTLSLEVPPPAPRATNPRRTRPDKVPARPPLESISSNSSFSSTNAGPSSTKTTTTTTAKPKPAPPTARRSSPRFRKTQSTSVIDALDLTLLTSPAPSPAPKPCPSAPAEPLSRQSPPTSTSTSPPAAWKAHSKKKRDIILRQSVVGSWDFADRVADPEAGGAEVVKWKARKRWRESEIQVLDLS